MADELQRSVEVERSYDVDPVTPLPDWESVPGLVRVSEGEIRPLDAWYFDTEDGALARSGVAVRRRTGGPDEGWHIKGPKQGDARIELHWPLGDVGDDIPAEIRDALAQWTTAPLSPLARIENTRTAYLLYGDEGVLAEFVDDRVRATDLRQQVHREWREWELELGPAAEGKDFFADAEVAIRAAGATDASSDSKLARALGF